jgi:hypothetical protein
LVSNPSLANGNGLLSGILKEDTTLKSSLNTSVARKPIYLFSNSKELLHATFTDTYGNFNFSNVPYGSYLVQPEITGLHAEPYPVSLEPGNSSHTGITFTIGELGIQYGIDALLPHHISSIGQPFPNPSQGHFQLLIEADQACSGQLVLSNPNGSIIKHIQLDLTSGINRLHVNTESMPAGIYALILQTNSGKHFLSKIVVL